MKFEILGASGEVLNTVETQANPVRIGKNASCELCLDDISVSRVHATIEQTPEGYKLSDKLSMSGTFVNQQKLELNKSVVLNSGDVLAFGKVSVRVTFDAAADEEEVGGETLAIDASALNQSQAADELTPAVSLPTVPAVSIPSAPAVSVPAAPAVSAPKASGFGTAGGFSASSSPVGPTTIIRKKKRPVSFERRFLSARGKSEHCTLEAASVWQDTVLRIDKFANKGSHPILVGPEKNSYGKRNKKLSFILPTNNGTVHKIAQYNESRKKWEIFFGADDDGFLVVGDNKVPFSSASSPYTVEGDVRAKFIFGEASVLIRYVDTEPFAVPFFGNLQFSRYGSLVASFLIHFALFSVILFATNRVDALMIDRVMTASRFATVIEQPEPEEEEPEEPEKDEEEPEEEEPTEDAEVANDAPETAFAATASNDSAAGPGTGMSKGEANAAAQATGLLAQSNAMNSMLAAGMNMQALDNLDWSSFDSSAAASSAGYGLGTTGTGGGGAGLGGFGGGGFGPGGGGGGGAIRAAARNYNANLGAKGEAKPQVKMKNPEVSGSLDKRIIQKVVRQHHGELRACYEREVAKIKGLAGTITVVWLISPQGAVTKVIMKGSTMKNKNVEQCVTNAIKFWRFPAPKGGGAVQVEYPFDFQLN